jgi:hypothetical protein
LLGRPRRKLLPDRYPRNPSSKKVIQFLYLLLSGTAIAFFIASMSASQVAAKRGKVKYCCWKCDAFDHHPVPAGKLMHHLAQAHGLVEGGEECFARQLSSVPGLKVWCKKGMHESTIQDNARAGSVRTLVGGEHFAHTGTS